MPSSSRRDIPRSLDTASQVWQNRTDMVKQEQAAANQEWEDEGGSIKPPAETKPALASVPKIPF